MYTIHIHKTDVNDSVQSGKSNNVRKYNHFWTAVQPCVTPRMRAPHPSVTLFGEFSSSQIDTRWFPPSDLWSSASYAPPLSLSFTPIAIFYTPPLFPFSTFLSWALSLSLSTYPHFFCNLHSISSHSLVPLCGLVSSAHTYSLFFWYFLSICLLLRLVLVPCVRVWSQHVTSTLTHCLNWAVAGGIAGLSQPPHSLSHSLSHSPHPSLSLTPHLSVHFYSFLCMDKEG